MKPKAAGFLIVPLAIGLVACASYEIRPLIPQPIESYPLREISRGVTVVAESLATKEKAEAAFSVDLTEQGYAPILLVMENRSGDKILLVKDQIELVDGRGNLHKPVSAHVMAEKFGYGKLVRALLGFGPFFSLPAKEANKKMRSDWSRKELPAKKVLMPNQETHGVLYFELGPMLLTLPESALHIPLKNLRTGERHAVFLRIGPPSTMK